MLIGCGVGMAIPGGQRAPLSSAPSPAPALSRVTDLKQSGDLPGWKQVFEEDFSAGDVPLGAFPGDVYNTRWSAGYRDGTPDTAGKISGGKSGYYPSKVLSVRDGVLAWYLHSENGISMGAAPQPKFPNASAAPPRDNSLLYGRYSVKFMADSLAGFRMAWLLWPDSGAWPREGEIGFPEGDLAGAMYGAAHFRGPDPRSFERFFADKFFTSWHVATTEWSPGRVEFFIDGQSIGATTTYVPSTPMHLILQTESCQPGCPAPETQGHVYLDWISIWTRT
ncbi:MAG: glycoside hydrolase [Arthrobacter sp.]|nr:glycoside hydrolase [Arthrobacter sp.]